MVEDIYPMVNGIGSKGKLSLIKKNYAGEQKIKQVVK